MVLYGLRTRGDVDLVFQGGVEMSGGHLAINHLYVKTLPTLDGSQAQPLVMLAREHPIPGL